MLSIKCLFFCIKRVWEACLLYLACHVSLRGFKTYLVFLSPLLCHQRLGRKTEPIIYRLRLISWLRAINLKLPDEEFGLFLKNIPKPLNSLNTQCIADN